MQRAIPREGRDFRINSNFNLRMSLRSRTASRSKYFASKWCDTSNVQEQLKMTKAPLKLKEIVSVETKIVEGEVERITSCFRQPA